MLVRPGQPVEEEAALWLDQILDGLNISLLLSEKPNSLENKQTPRVTP
jgi:hypothetical protein